MTTRLYSNFREAKLDMQNLIIRYHNKKEFEWVLEFEAEEIRQRYAWAREIIMKECENAKDILQGLPKKLRLNIR